MRIKKALASGVVMLAAAGLLVGCSGDGDDDKGSSNDSSQTDDTSGEDDTDTDAGDADVSTGGEASVKVDGKDLEGFDASTITCVKNGGTITVGSSDTSAGLGVIMTDEDTPKVTSLGLIVDGVSLAVASGSGAEIGSADVAVDGDTYTITGTAEGSDTENPTELVKKDIEIVVTCD